MMSRYPGRLSGYGSGTVMEKMSTSRATTLTTAPLHARAISQPPHSMTDGSGDTPAGPTFLLWSGDAFEAARLATTNLGVTEPLQHQNRRRLVAESLSGRSMRGRGGRWCRRADDHRVLCTGGAPGEQRDQRQHTHRRSHHEVLRVLATGSEPLEHMQCQSHKPLPEREAESPSRRCA